MLIIPTLAKWLSVTAIRMLKWVAVMLFALLILVMAYGFYSYPVAPIRYVDGQYVDKRGSHHSIEEFERFRVWERVFIASWVGSAASAAALQYARRRHRS